MDQREQGKTESAERAAINQRQLNQHIDGGESRSPARSNNDDSDGEPRKPTTVNQLVIDRKPRNSTPTEQLLGRYEISASREAGN